MLQEFTCTNAGFQHGTLGFETVSVRQHPHQLANPIRGEEFIQDPFAFGALGSLAAGTFVLGNKVFFRRRVRVAGGILLLDEGCDFIVQFKLVHQPRVLCVSSRPFFPNTLRI